MRALIPIAGKLLLQRGFIPKLVMACAIMFLGVFVPLLQFFPMLRTDGDGRIATLPIALDIVFLNARVNQFNGLQGLLPEPLGLF